MTIIQLIDFHCQEDYNQFNNTSSSSQLFNYLKSKLGTFKSYSKEFHKITTITHSHLKLFTCYDSVIYDDFVILGGLGKLHLFNRFTNKYIKSIKIYISIHGMHLHESFLYMTGVDGDGHSKCFKFDINMLLSGSSNGNGLIWKSRDGMLQSSWGVSVFNNRVYVVDSTITCFDVENGDLVNEPIFVPEMEIGSGFGIVFTPNMEMILSRSSFFAHEPSCPLEMYKFNSQDGKWHLTHKAEPNFKIDRGSYGIFYEKSTNLLYQVDRKAKRINIFQKQFEKLVREDAFFPLATTYHYSISIDKETGHLYLPIVDGSLMVLK